MKASRVHIKSILTLLRQYKIIWSSKNLSKNYIFNNLKKFQKKEFYLIEHFEIFSKTAMIIKVTHFKAASLQNFRTPLVTSSRSKYC